MINRSTISFVGYGNLAYRLSLALKRAGHQIEYVYGRDLEQATKLAMALNGEVSASNMAAAKNLCTTQATTNLSLIQSSEVVIFAVSDSAIDLVAKQFTALLEEGKEPPFTLHCSGSTDLDALSPLPNRGVFYPLMTLSKGKEVDFSLVPFLLEGNNNKTKELLITLTNSLLSEYKFLDSKERRVMHLAALFINNFGNHLIGQAFDIATPHSPFLMPLAIETVRKAFLYNNTVKAQTGPAVRGDRVTMQKHLAYLKEHHPNLLEFYTLFSNAIEEKQKK